MKLVQYNEHFISIVVTGGLVFSIFLQEGIILGMGSANERCHCATATP